ncbi:glycoside hydrolase family 43 protein [Auriculariales sp. MPI-PUGE-AT-0066]|nr:glycoside hydrolase family 43 protein [Auriculariales sp. MPI-PUGE-AT-0066]
MVLFPCLLLFLPYLCLLFLLFQTLLFWFQHKVSVLLASVSAAVSSVAALDLSGTLLPGSSNVVCRDPTIAYRQITKKYHVFCTTKGFPMFTALSLKGPWTAAGTVLPNGSKIQVLDNADYGYWAPDIAKVDNQFVLSYSLAQKGAKNYYVGVATSPTMEPGSWTDHGEVLRSVAPSRLFAVDPNILRVGNVTYMQYGSFIDGIFQVTLDANWKTHDTYPGRHIVGGNNMPAEGGFLYKPLSSDYYFMFYSHGTTMLEGMTKPLTPGKEYKVRVGRSKSPTGPFVGPMGNELTNWKVDPPVGMIILESHNNLYAPGGQSVYLDPVSNRPVMIYHYVPRDKLGGQSFLGISYLNFTSGWPVIVRE